MHPIALVCTALLGLLLFGLGLGVSILRFREKTGAGCDTNPANRLHKMVRAHANTAEFAPFLAVLFLFLGSRDPGLPVLAMIVGVTLCRFLLVAGILTSPTLARPHPLRFVGALGTYLLGAALSITLLFTLPA